jgi:hypothetical protein
MPHDLGIYGDNSYHFSPDEVFEPASDNVFQDVLLDEDWLRFIDTPQSSTVSDGFTGFETPQNPVWDLASNVPTSEGVLSSGEVAALEEFLHPTPEVLPQNSTIESSPSSDGLATSLQPLQFSLGANLNDATPYGGVGPNGVGVTQQPLQAASGVDQNFESPWANQIVVTDANGNFAFADAPAPTTPDQDASMLRRLLREEKKLHLACINKRIELQSQFDTVAAHGKMVRTEATQLKAEVQALRLEAHELKFTLARKEEFIQVCKQKFAVVTKSLEGKMANLHAYNVQLSKQRDTSIQNTATASREACYWKALCEHANVTPLLENQIPLLTASQIFANANLSESGHPQNGLAPNILPVFSTTNPTKFVTAAVGGGYSSPPVPTLLSHSTAASPGFRTAVQTSAISSSPPSVIGYTATDVLASPASVNTYISHSSPANFQISPAATLLDHSVTVDQYPTAAAAPPAATYNAFLQPVGDLVGDLRDNVKHAATAVEEPLADQVTETAPSSPVAIDLTTPSPSPCVDPPHRRPNWLSGTVRGGSGSNFGPPPSPNVARFPQGPLKMTAPGTKRARSALLSKHANGLNASTDDGDVEDPQTLKQRLQTEARERQKALKQRVNRQLLSADSDDDLADEEPPSKKQNRSSSNLSQKKLAERAAADERKRIAKENQKAERAKIAEQKAAEKAETTAEKNWQKFQDKANKIFVKNMDNIEAFKTETAHLFPMFEKLLTKYSPEWVPGLVPDWKALQENITSHKVWGYLHAFVAEKNETFEAEKKKLAAKETEEQQLVELAMEKELMDWSSDESEEE